MKFPVPKAVLSKDIQHFAIMAIIKIVLTITIAGCISEEGLLSVEVLDCRKNGVSFLVCQQLKPSQDVDALTWQVSSFN